MLFRSKQKRKDSFIYKLTSKIANKSVKLLTGVEVHDMNNGFKAYQSHIAKSMRLQAGYFRFIPALLSRKNCKVTEVPVEHRKRQFHEGKFNFKERLKSGLFDFVSMFVVKMMGDSPMHLFGSAALLLCALGIASIIPSFFLSDLFLQIFFLGLGFTLLVLTGVTLLVGFANEYLRYQLPPREGKIQVVEQFPEKE